MQLLKVLLCAFLLISTAFSLPLESENGEIRAENSHRVKRYGYGYGYGYGGYGYGYGGYGGYGYGYRRWRPWGFYRPWGWGGWYGK